MALRLSVVESFRKRELATWTEKFVHPDSIVVSDGLGYFNGTAAGVEHQPVVTGGGYACVEMEEFRNVSEFSTLCPTLSTKTREVGAIYLGGEIQK